MITILSRIFPYDISEYIYNIHKKSLIDDIMIPKLYMFELTLDNLLKIYSNHNNTLIYANLNGFNLIKNGIYYIKKYNYEIEPTLEIKIKKLIEITKGIPLKPQLP